MESSENHKMAKHDMHSNTDTDTEIPTEQCHTDTDTGKGGGMETVCNSSPNAVQGGKGLRCYSYHISDGSIF